MKLLILSCFLPAVIFAVPPVWHPSGPCGKSKYKDAGDYFLPAPTIVGGIQARPNEFPWQVSLKSSTTKRHLCGGSIINDRWILTAAHCIVPRPVSQFNVVVGEHVLNENSTSEVIHSIEKAIIHENYKPSTVNYDIALLKVKIAIKLNENVAPVCAPDYNDQFAHKKVAVSGWGKTNTGAETNVLLYTTLNTTTNDYCKKFYGEESITPDMLCTSDNKNSTQRDSCQGDSGGPLVIKDSKGIFSLIGVVSWGSGCAENYPGVYSRVNYVHDWILKNIKV